MSKGIGGFEDMEDVLGWRGTGGDATIVSWSFGSDAGGATGTAGRGDAVALCVLILIDDVLGKGAGRFGSIGGGTTGGGGTNASLGFVLK